LASPTAAIVTIGSELTSGLRVDTNTAEIARALAPRGFVVHETVSIGDDANLLAEELARLCAVRQLVITTGGLGPTHDDITRDAATRALGLEFRADERLVGLLRPIQSRHTDPDAAMQVLVQARIPAGAEVIDFSTGTAPGLIIESPAGLLCLLPGPPSEMRPMLRVLLDRFDVVRSEPRELGVVGLSESDAQVMVQRAIAGMDGIGFTILARPGDVRVILTDEGAGSDVLDTAASRACDALGARCYATDGSTLAHAIVREGRARGATIALAESCTGGMVAAALTDVPGSSAVFLGGVVSYANSAKVGILGVPAAAIQSEGAVSQTTVEAMVDGARAVFGGPDVTVAVTGIAGPDGGTPDKPVGTVWFGIRAYDAPVVSFKRHYPGSSRDAIRARATSTALDLIRRAILGMDVES